jgi:hypothetical protein
MVPAAAAAPAGSSPFGAAAAALLSAAGSGLDVIRLAVERRRLARHDRQLADDRRDLVALARAHADTQPSFAADLYAAATRHGAD